MPRKSCCFGGAEHTHLVDPAAEVGRHADVGRGRHQAVRRPPAALPSPVSRRPNVSCVETGRLLVMTRSRREDRKPGSGRYRPVVQERSPTERAEPPFRRAGDRSGPTRCSRRGRPRDGRRRSVPGTGARRGSAGRRRWAGPSPSRCRRRPRWAGRARRRRRGRPRPAPAGRARRGSGPTVPARRRARRARKAVTSSSAPARNRARQRRRRGGRTATGTPRSTCRRCVGAGARRPGRANAARRRWPYLASTTCHPESAKNFISLWTFMPGMTRSRLCRLTSMIHITLPSPWSARVGDGFPDVALVQLGVADQSDEAGRPLRAEVGLDVAAGHGREQRRDRAQADGSGREVGDVGVLRPRRVGLQAAEAPAAASGRSGRAHPSGT